MIDASPMPHGFLGALSLVLQLAAAQAMATRAAAQPVPVAVEKPPVTTAAALLASAQANRMMRESASLYRRLLAEFDGTPEAVTAGLALAERIQHEWHPWGDQLAGIVNDLHLIERSKAYQLPGAATLRSVVAPLVVEVASWAAAWQFVELGHRGLPDGFSRGAEAYLALHSRLDADDHRGPVALYNATQCFEAAALWPEAARTYERLLALYPNDEHVPTSLSNLASINFAVARYEDAARYGELYAARYPKDRQHTPNHLHNAYLARVGLDQRVKALADLDALETLYIVDYPEMAARYFWLRREFLTRDDERLEHAETYLKRHGKRGGRDRLIVAEAVIGQLEWQRTCKRALVGEACITMSREMPARAASGRPKGKAHPTCAEPSMVRITVLPRAQKPAEHAQRYLHAVIKMAGDRLMIPEDDRPRQQAFTDAFAMATVLHADRGFEELLALVQALRELPAEDPQAALLLAQIARAADELERTYTKVVTWEYRVPEPSPRGREWLARGPDDDVTTPIRSVIWAIAATARIAQIAEARADALPLRTVDLRTLKVDPRATAGRSPLEHHCHGIRTDTAALRSAAQAAYERCLALSTSTGTFTPFSRLCEEALYRRDPARFPKLAEFVGVPAISPSRPDVIGVQKEPPPELAAGPDAAVSDAP